MNRPAAVIATLGLTLILAVGCTSMTSSSGKTNESTRPAATAAQPNEALPAGEGTALTFAGLSGNIAKLAKPARLPGATAYEASDDKAPSIEYSVAPGTLHDGGWLSFDVLLNSDTSAGFELRFYQPGNPKPFRLSFMALTQAQARIRFAVNAMNLNKSYLTREGATMKPQCNGQRLDPSKVDRITLAVTRTGGRRVWFDVTPPVTSDREPALLKDPMLPQGKLLDRFGQSAVRDWPGKTRSEAELTKHLQAQLHDAAGAEFPEGFSKWGGWTKERYEATGFFRVEKTANGWQMVDPDGYAWWSAGLDCVTPSIAAAVGGLTTALEEPPTGPAYEGFVKERPGTMTVDFLAANLRRAFGETWQKDWATATVGEFKRLGFNTFGNWSQWQVARDAHLPYVRPLNGGPRLAPRIYRELPDVFDPLYEQEATEFAKQLEETKDDPAFVGYFLSNEPQWCSAEECPAAAMLYSHETSHTRDRLAEFLRERYGTDAALADAWGMDVTLEQVRTGVWHQPMRRGAHADLEEFSTILVDRAFGTLSRACHAVDPHHLNLGVRYMFRPQAWALAGMKSFDVFSINAYDPEVPGDYGEKIAAVVDRPLLIGEWHFGALDAGLPSSGLCRVATQADRGKAYRVYLENAAAKPWCVGVQYFTMYDESAIGRYDGENYNIGFFDVCNRPYEAMAAAAKASHQRMYRVRAGHVQPYSKRPKYLPNLA